MLTELRHASADGTPVEELRGVASRLLREQFLYQFESRDKSAYATARTHFSYFEKLFDALGWTLHRDDQLGYIGAVPGEHSGFTPIKVDETVVLLVLALMFEEAVERHEAGPEGVTVTGKAIAVAHGAAGRDAPMQTRMKQILQVFQRRGFVVCDLDGPLDEVMVTIRGTIRLVTGQGVRTKLEGFTKLGKDLDLEPEPPAKSGEDEA
jgi:hypothetical protein